MRMSYIMSETISLPLFTCVYLTCGNQKEQKLHFTTTQKPKQVGMRLTKKQRWKKSSTLAKGLREHGGRSKRVHFRVVQHGIAIPGRTMGYHAPRKLVSDLTFLAGIAGLKASLLMYVQVASQQFGEKTLGDRCILGH